MTKFTVPTHVLAVSLTYSWLLASKLKRNTVGGRGDSEICHQLTACNELSSASAGHQSLSIHDIQIENAACMIEAILIFLAEDIMTTSSSQ